MYKSVTFNFLSLSLLMNLYSTSFAADPLEAADFHPLQVANNAPAFNGKTGAIVPIAHNDKRWLVLLEYKNGEYGLIRTRTKYKVTHETMNSELNNRTNLMYGIPEFKRGQKLSKQERDVYQKKGLEYLEKQPKTDVFFLDETKQQRIFPRKVNFISIKKEKTLQWVPLAQIILGKKEIKVGKNQTVKISDETSRSLQHDLFPKNKYSPATLPKFDSK